MSDDQNVIATNTMSGLAMPMPLEIGDIDAAWLTGALASRLPAGVRVRSFSVETIGTGVGLMGLLYRLAVDYDCDVDHRTPSTAIIKLPVLIDATREVALAYRFYEKEVAFYRALAAQTPMRTPDIYFAAHDLDTDNFVIVMEDVGCLRAADQVAGCERDDALAAVAALAQHHAAFWDDPRLSTEELAWLPLGSDEPFPDGVRQSFTRAWEPFVEFMGRDLCPEIKAVGEWLPGAVHDLMAVPDGHAVTVTHGDYRLDNLFFDDSHSVTALDWQLTFKGVGGYDFAYFISQSLTAADRRSHLDELADTYLTTLAESGIDYPAEHFWLDVRRTLLFCLAYPVQAMALDLTDPRAATLVREMAHRASSAIIELGALQLLPG